MWSAPQRGSKQNKNKNNKKQCPLLSTMPPPPARRLLRLVLSPGPLPILRHLRLEEAALRAAPADSAWAFVTDGVVDPALVLGVSG